LDYLNIIIPGIPDEKTAPSAELDELIATGYYFAGGERHFQLIKDYLPKEHKWVTIGNPLSGFLDEIKHHPSRWIIFASGDPWFFGIAMTLKREFPHATIEVFPHYNSLQILGHRLGINYGEYKTVSLTGRPWHEFDKALITGEKKLALLTDRTKTPATIAERMLNYGYANYKMLYGEHLGGKEEKVAALTLNEALTFPFQHPNCLFLEKMNDAVPRKMIPENDFQLLENRSNMITKMPIRLATLASMRLDTKKVFWDIGACTGSVSIEVRLNYPDLHITSFELHPERMAVFTENCLRFQCPGIQQFEGDYLAIDKEKLERPDAVFLGGYNGEMEEILHDVAERLQSGGVIAFNSVTEISYTRFLAWAENNDFGVCFQQCIRVDEHNPIHIITIKKK
jgi:precorrin-6B C5,15-methyltransferase / cobalt-precorrin-6B C5,C15-methyltransferase